MFVFTLYRMVLLKNENKNCMACEHYKNTDYYDKNVKKLYLGYGEGFY